MQTLGDAEAERALLDDLASGPLELVQRWRKSDSLMGFFWWREGARHHRLATAIRLIQAGAVQVHNQPNSTVLVMTEHEHDGSRSSCGAT